MRESTTFPGDYTLCVAHAAMVENYHIVNAKDKLTVDEETFFETLIQLIQVVLRWGGGGVVGVSVCMLCLLEL